MNARTQLRATVARAAHLALFLAPAFAQRSAVEPHALAHDVAACDSESVAAPRFELDGDSGFVLAHPDREFEARVESRGVRFAGAEWQLELATESIGRAGTQRATQPVQPVADGARVELDRGFALEWFEPHARGVEQLWSLPSAPFGGGPGDPLIVRVALAGDLTPRLALDGAAVFFHDASGKPQLRYGELYAFDATGRELATSLALVEGALEVRVDDSGATYPITIDPLTSPATWSAESNQAGAFFGTSVSSAGDVNGDGFSDLIVGAPRFDSNTLTDNGAVRVYYGSLSGLSASANWSVLGTQAGAQLGVSVSTAGDVNGDGFDDFVAGEPYYDGGLTNEGRCHLFLGSANGPTATTWAPEGDQANAEFGYAIAWAGDVNGDDFDDVLVGAPRYDAGSTDEGRAFVYLGTPLGLSASPVWIEEPDQAGALYGFSVATAGDVNADGYDDVIVGAPYYNNGASTDAGAVYVHLGGPFGPSTTPVYFGSVSHVGARTGWSVGPAGDVNGDGYADVTFGAPWFDVDQTDEGRVWVKLGASTGITETGSWIEDGNGTSIGWGYGAYAAGDVNGDGFADLIASAVYWESSGGTSDEGGVWLYSGSKTGLPPGAAQLVAEGNQTNAYFGHRVGVAGDVNGDGYADVFIATGYFDAGQVDEGKVWVHYGYPSPVASVAQWSTEPNFTNANHGEAVAIAGDVNGDGFDDLLVAAGGFPNVFAQGGRVSLYSGKVAPLATSASWTVDAVQVGERVGANQGVAAAGDVNGDGYADVIVGSMGFDNSFADAGRARLYLGSSTGLSTTAAWTYAGSSVGALLGGAVCGAGDVNGDGFADVLVAAEGFGGGVGRVYLFKGSSTGLSATPDWFADSPHATVSSAPAFGTNVASAGDVDRDGFSDVLISAPHNGSGQRVYLFRGKRTGLSAAPAWTYSNLEWGLQPHWTIQGAGVGDVNGDGFGDVLIGAELESFQAGHIALFLGAANGLATSAAWETTGAANARLGRSVARAGDVNADGLADFAAGAPYQTAEQASEGVLHIRYGSRTAPGASGLTHSSTLANAGYGWSCSGAGDLDGDGYSDLALGAPLSDNPTLDEGRAYVSYGNAASSRKRAIQQRRLDDSAPIALLGAGDTAFRVAFDAFSPAGRSELSLEWELAPASEAFDKAGLERSPLAFDSGVPTGGQSAVRISEVVAGLAGRTLFHWRARVISDHPLFPRSPWFYAAGACSSEPMLRSAP